MIRTIRVAAYSLMALGLATASGITINWTPSIPVGLWQQTRITGPVRPGDIIRICPPSDPQTQRYVERGGFCPGNVLPYDKPVAAVAGDIVTTSGRGSLFINGKPFLGSAPLPTDTAGRPLKPYPEGTYVVPVGQVWVISTSNPGSYDSRYFGPLDASGVIGTLTPVLTFS